MVFLELMISNKGNSQINAITDKNIREVKVELSILLYLFINIIFSFYQMVLNKDKNIFLLNKVLLLYVSQKEPYVFTGRWNNFGVFFVDDSLTLLRKEESIHNVDS